MSTPPSRQPARVDVAAFAGSAALAVTDPTRLLEGRALLQDFIYTFDRAASRFRDDSELVRLRDASPEPAQISPLLAGALRAALDAAEMTGGLVDPTIGSSLVDAGYDRDLDAIDTRVDTPTATPAAGWQHVHLDNDTRTITVPAGVQLDLGATGKAYAADRAAADLAVTLGCGVLVSFGGDVAVAGATPADGWAVHIAERPGSTSYEATAQTVTIRTGGLATSSTLLRHWRRGGITLHHILDPATGSPAPVVWRTVTVAAATCVDANAASTAAVILGPEAPDWLAECDLPARLVRADGQIVRVGGWPANDTHRAQVMSA